MYRVKKYILVACIIMNIFLRFQIFRHAFSDCPMLIITHTESCLLLQSKRKVLWREFVKCSHAVQLLGQTMKRTTNVYLCLICISVRMSKLANVLCVSWFPRTLILPNLANCSYNKKYPVPIQRFPSTDLKTFHSVTHYLFFILQIEKP